jgi:hypothetical protein
MSANDLIHRGLDELRVLRGELEQAVKTASVEAKEGWKKLQPHLQEAEKLASERASGIAEELGKSAGDLIVDVRGQLEKLRERIRNEQS